MIFLAMQNSRRIDKESQKWGETVRAVMKRGGAPGKNVAAAVCWNDSARDQSLLHQYLSGRRRPNPERVRSIAKAVGTLIRDEATAYLEADARVHGLLDADLDALLGDGLAAFGLVFGDIPFGFATRFVEGIATLPEPARAKLLAELHREHRKLLFNALGGRVRVPDALEALRKTLAARRLNLDTLLDEGALGGSQEAQVNAGLHRDIRDAFARFFPDSSARERFEAEQAIKRAIGLYLGGHPRISIGSLPQSLAEAVHQNSTVFPVRPKALAKGSRFQRRRKGKKQ